MGSWGASDTADHKPRFLSDVEKRDCYATDRGWTVAAGGNDGISEGVAATGTSVPDREVLVTIGNLGGATATDLLDAANISSVNWITSSFSKAAGGTMSVSINFNETVTVTGTPRVTLTNDTPARNLTLDYASGSTTNRLTFTSTIAADDAATDADDVLSIGLNAVAQNGGSTIVNTVGGGNATITSAAYATSLTVAT